MDQKLSGRVEEDLALMHYHELVRQGLRRTEEVRDVVRKAKGLPARRRSLMRRLAHVVGS
ncbi:hypothetical protein LR090_05780 [Candidatus Bipolaricaulota bacterium]|nr:hypothetical protein [Candidatus Bipolaricaulota bacterium]